MAKPRRELPLRLLDESDIPGAFEGIELCVQNFDEGFAPFNVEPWQFSCHYYSDFIPVTELTHELEANRHRMLLTGGAEGNNIAYSGTSGLAAANWFEPPVQLQPCARAFSISFDYSIVLTLTEPEFDYAQLTFGVYRVKENGFDSSAAQIDSVLIHRKTPGTTSGTYTFNISAGTVPEGQFVTITFGTWLYVEAGTNASRTAEVIIENVSIQ